MKDIASLILDSSSIIKSIILNNLLEFPIISKVGKSLPIKIEFTSSFPASSKFWYVYTSPLFSS